METIQKDTQREQKKTEKNWTEHNELWDNFKWPNIHVIRKGGRRQKIT